MEEKKILLNIYRCFSIDILFSKPDNYVLRFFPTNITRIWFDLFICNLYLYLRLL